MCQVCDEFGGPEAAAEALIAADEIEDVVDFGAADRVVLVKTKFGVSLYVFRGDEMGGMQMVATEEGYAANVFPFLSDEDLNNQKGDS